MTVEEIIAKHPTEWQKFKDGEDLIMLPFLYAAFYDHYCTTGEMPYGTMKARDGDPDVWIADRLEAYL